MTLHKSDEWDNDDDRDKAAVDKPNSEGNKECREDEDEVRNYIVAKWKVLDLEERHFLLHSSSTIKLLSQ